MKVAPPSDSRSLILILNERENKVQIQRETTGISVSFDTNTEAFGAQRQNRQAGLPGAAQPG
jgi:hypothetical protein